MEKRGSGILLHISSLPSAYGIGDLGPSAYQFVDFLKSTEQNYWQLLPLNPTDTAYGNSPYSSVSAFAVNTLLISPELMVEAGWLEENELEPKPAFSLERVDYTAVTAYKRKLFDIAFERFRRMNDSKNDYKKFCQEHKDWLDDFALFVVLKEHFKGQSFTAWPREVRDRAPAALEDLRDQLRDALEKTKFLQYVFFKQWFELRLYCRRRNVKLIGDIPIYVNDDSADVWTNPGIFKLNEEKRPWVVAGVPPDYFSATGQRWGNPVYDWQQLKDTSYAWWVKRIGHNLKLFDIVRIDHFRGLIAYWEIPCEEKTAVKGNWVGVPHDDFFTSLLREFPRLPLIAEDLGIITPDVTAAMEKFGFPGMKVLLFAFAGDQNTHPYQPRNYAKNCVVYTGTHDNNTTRGWFENEMSEEERNNLFGCFGRQVSAEEVSSELIRVAMESVADTCIVPMQDVLGLGKASRMNTPATVGGNWEWRLSPEGLNRTVQRKLLTVTEASGRK